MKIISFDPIADQNSKVLILGTVPGGDSLRKREYYAASSNDFWKFVSFIISNEINGTYQKKVEKLKQNNIAIWDVIKECERENSSDNKIRNPVPNDFVSFFSSRPSIKAVFFNGSKAFKLYNRLVGFIEDKYYKELPSSSGSPGRYVKSFDEKSKDWLEIKEILKK